MISSNHVLLVLLVVSCVMLGDALREGRRKIIVDQDCSGPATSNTNSISALLSSSQVEVLGITVSSGDAWMVEEVQHCLRLLEILNVSNVPVYAGAIVPLVRTPETMAAWERAFGDLAWKGAFSGKHGPYEIRPIDFPEGLPTHSKQGDKSAAQFIVDTIHSQPLGSVSIVALGPMTNIAAAMVIEPKLPSMVEELFFMGGALGCTERNDVEQVGQHCDDIDRPRHEFNFLFDPEAMHKVLIANTQISPPWKRITVLPSDIASQPMWISTFKQSILANVSTPFAKYLRDYLLEPESPNAQFPMFDELTAVAFLYPDQVLVNPEQLYMTVDLSKGAGYGATITYRASSSSSSSQQLLSPLGTPPPSDKTQTLQSVTVYKTINLDRYYQLFLQLINAGTPQEH